MPASFLLHAFLLALLLVSFGRQKPELSLPLNGVSVVFEGAPQSSTLNTAPRRNITSQASPTKGLPPPPAPAPAPPEFLPNPPAPAPSHALPTPPAPAPAPPPPEITEAEPDVHLAPIAPEPFQPQETPAPRFIVPPPRPAPAPRPRQHYLVMNGMSFSGPPAPEVLNPGHHGLDLRPANNDATQQSTLVEIQGHVGSGWDDALKRWAQENGYYPEAAARLNQQGDVTVDLVIDRSGRVLSTKLVKGSKSAFLNMAWYGLWRDAQVPPFPPGTRDKTVKIRFTARYMLIP